MAGAGVSFEIVQKPTFLSQLLALPRERMPQIMEKVALLADDPAPHGALKKKLHGYKGDVYRLRSGDYRVIYTYGDGWVALLGVDDRKDVYRGERLVADELSAPMGALRNLDAILEPTEQPAVGGPRRPTDDSDALPVRIDDDLLQRLRIPTPHWAALRACRTVDGLISADVPAPVRDRLFDIVTDPNFDQVLEQPSLAVHDVTDLLRFKDGELLSFLLKLSPEQEKFVSWSLNAGGPTLVKGGPGAGKSTVALQRAQVILDALRRGGTIEPRILFTTYTTALASSSRQQLASLLGPDARHVEVRTADSLAMAVASAATGHRPIAETTQIHKALTEAVTTAPFEGNALARRAQADTVARLSADYLLDEFGAVIEGREILSLDAYLAAARPGRLVSLNATQRRAVWQVYTGFVAALDRAGVGTWSQLRRRAIEIVRSGQGPVPYDAVIVDEAQDLEATVLRLLVELCRASNRLFVTADANQSIYGSGFRWQDVHQSLRFQGRTGVLRANYRSTREIGEAAAAYLAGGALDDEEGSSVSGTDYLHSGPAPTVRAVETTFDESRLLARFLPGAARAFRLGLDACAVLAPSEKAGKAIAAELTQQGVESAFMAGRDLDLARRCVKVITLKSAKGLEFPVVALAGFVDGHYPFLPWDAAAEEVSETLRRERRTMYVAMTRAMRALLVVVPDAPPGRVSPLLHGFDAALWNLGA